MIARAELKARAKKRFTGPNYMICVGVVVIGMLIGLAISMFSASMPTDRPLDMPLSQVLLFLAITFLGNLLLAPIAVEQDYFFLRIYREEEATVGSFLHGLLFDVGRKLAAILWQWLFFALWALPFLATFTLLYVYTPEQSGAPLLTIALSVAVIALEVLFFVKTLRYAMISYIVRDCPELSTREVMKRSIDLMTGHRWELVKLQLSFLGWFIASLLLLLIPLVLYVAPYMSATMAGFYDELKKDAQRRETGESSAVQDVGSHQADAEQDPDSHESDTEHLQ